MKLKLEAACGCNTGMYRENNEDNFYFNGKYLKMINDGLKHMYCKKISLKHSSLFAVFDGMGGEAYGEVASFVAARQMHRSRLILYRNMRIYLHGIAEKLNVAVVKKKNKQRTERMGTTMVVLCFRGEDVGLCNIGDSRAYQLRNGRLSQISEEHVMELPGRNGTLLTQYVGVDPEDMTIEPYIFQEKLQQGDRYLICSDGLTDALSDEQIEKIMKTNEDTNHCVQALIQEALHSGCLDNITAIVCKIK